MDRYTRASGTGGRGTDGVDGYDRGPGRRAGVADRDGEPARDRASRGGVREGGRTSGRDGAGSQSGGNDDGGYRSRRDAPGEYGPGRHGDRRRPSDRAGSAGPGDSWDERGGRAARDRDPSRSGTGHRDVRADLRERLRRNGIGTGDWDGADGAGPHGRRARNLAEESDWGTQGGGGPSRWRRGKQAGEGDAGDWGDGPDGRPPRRKGSWWRHWTWKKALTLVAATFGLLLIVAAAGVAYAYSKTPIPAIQTAVFQQASKVYFSDGAAEVGQFGTTNRVLLNYNQFPPLLRNAVVAAEDKNFWNEGGISPTGIVRAAYYDLTSSGGSLQGASTITQQLVRNYYDNIGTGQTASRKIKEIFVAVKLAKAESKEWILTQYLNTIYLGHGAYGVGAAAQVYFGLPANKLSQITPAQAAMIAAMIQQPGGYSPNPKDGQAYQGLVYRWHYVLSAMASMGTVSPQVAAGQKFPTVVPPVNNSWSGYQGYIMQAVQNELVTTYHYSASKIATGGLHVVTTFDKKLMNSLYASVRSNERLMRRCTPPAGLSAAPAACTNLPKYVHVGAVLEKPSNGAIEAMYSGANYNKVQYDDALQSRNQVGSSFKPYVLATAVQQGMNVQSSVLNGDSPLWIPPDSAPTTFAKTGTQAPASGGYYEVVNDESGGNNLGPVSVEVATAASLNTAYTDLWHRVALNSQTGAYNVVNMAKAFGVDTHTSGLYRVGRTPGMQDEAGTALGQASLTVEEQATMIATLANNGIYSTPHVIQQITVGSSVIPAKIEHREVLTPAQAADVDWAMSFDTSAGGTAAGLGLTNGQAVIAKTGTTNLSQSAFFMGATPKAAMAVGMFVSKPNCPPRLTVLCHSTAALAFAPPQGLQTLFGVGGLSGYGGQYPALIWHTFFMRNFNGGVPVAFPPVNNDGHAWNLMNPADLTKPKHHSHPDGGGPPGCHGQGPCHGSPPPTSNPTPTPTTQPTPTPSPTPTRHGIGVTTRGAVSGGSGSGRGALALVGVVAIGPALSLLGRLRNRRRRAVRPPGRQPAS